MLIPKSSEDGGQPVIWTLLFIVVCVTLYIAGLVTGTGGDALMLPVNGHSTKQFFTAMFAHHDIVHLLLSCSGLWLAGLILENRGGYSAFVLSILVGGIAGEVFHVMVFRGAAGSLVGGMEGGATAAMVSGLALWPEERLLFSFRGKMRETPAWLWAVGWIVLVGVYDSAFMIITHTLPGWGLIPGGLIAGLALTVALKFMGTGRRLDAVRARVETASAARNMRSTLNRSPSYEAPPPAEQEVPPAVLEEQMQEALNNNDTYQAVQAGVHLMQLFLIDDMPDEARRILLLLDNALGEPRVPGKILVEITQHCIDMALITQAKILVNRIIRMEMDAPGMEDLLFRIIEVLVDTSSADVESAEFFLSRYALLGAPPQNVEYLRGKVFKLKVAARIGPEERKIIDMIYSEYYEDALEAVRYQGDNVGVPPEALLTLARGLLMLPAVEDAAEVLALIAHQFAEAPETAEAVYQLVQIFQEHLDDPQRSATWYEFLKEAFPNAPATQQARSYMERVAAQRRRER